MGDAYRDKDMRAIFISYRRDDAEGQAGRLFDDLIKHFGEDAVFMDVAAIEPGRDFRRVIDEQVASCGVLLAIIGKSWLTAETESGTRRLDDPTDFVRLETASALKRDIPVIPVLVHAAGMPRVEDLPEDLKELAFRNGVELTHARWDSDLQVLVKALRPYVQTKQEPPAWPGPPSAPSQPVAIRTRASRTIFAVLLGVLVLAFGGFAWHQKSSETVAREAAAEADRINKDKIAADQAAARQTNALAAAEKERRPDSTAKFDAANHPERDRPKVPTEIAPPELKNLLSFRDWEGWWDLQWEFEGQWYGKPMKLKSDRSGIAGDYVLGTLKGNFVNGDISKVTGAIKNVTETGKACPSGEQTGLFSLALSNDGGSMDGWWDVCGEGRKYKWKALKRNVS